MQPSRPKQAENIIPSTSLSNHIPNVFLVKKVANTDLNHFTSQATDYTTIASQMKCKLWDLQVPPYQAVLGGKPWIYSGHGQNPFRVYVFVPIEPIFVPGELLDELLKRPTIFTRSFCNLNTSVVNMAHDHDTDASRCNIDALAS